MLSIELTADGSAVLEINVAGFLRAFRLSPAAVATLRMALLYGGSAGVPLEEEGTRE